LHSKRIADFIWNMLVELVGVVLLAAPVETPAKLLSAGKFEKCVALADVQVGQMRKESAPKADEMARMLLTKASCLRALNREEAMKQALVEAAEASPTLSIDRQRFAPDFVEFFEQAQLALEATLSIDGAPTTLVSVDGQPGMALPLKLKLKPGSHQLVSETPSHTERIELKFRETRVVEWPQPSEPVSAQILPPVTLPAKEPDLSASLAMRRDAPPRKLAVAPIVVGAVGLVATGVGTYFVLNAQRRYTALVSRQTDVVGANLNDAEAFAAAGARERLAGSVTAGTGVAVTVTGLIWLIADLAAQPRKEP
jgi:hypothetical protein